PAPPPPPLPQPRHPPAASGWHGSAAAAEGAVAGRNPPAPRTADVRCLVRWCESRHAAALNASPVKPPRVEELHAADLVGGEQPQAGPIPGVRGINGQDDTIKPIMSGEE
ncbi:hypothetical protein Vretimale_16873, partial [Volvox reticuliferus]